MINYKSEQDIEARAVYYYVSNIRYFCILLDTTIINYEDLIVILNLDNLK